MKFEQKDAIVPVTFRCQPFFATAPSSSAIINIDVGQDLQLLPQEHGTDGFFAAVLERAPKAVVAKPDVAEDVAEEEPAPTES